MYFFIKKSNLPAAPHKNIAKNHENIIKLLSLGESIYFMKRILLIFISIVVAQAAIAQGNDGYVMGYNTATISVKNNEFFQQLHFPGQNPVCGFYDRWAGNFYTCDYSTYREVEEDFVEPTSLECCAIVDFDARKYYGSLTVIGTVDTVEWDNLIIKLTTANAQYLIKTDEKEIDAFYDRFYSKGRIGKLNIRLMLVTYDNVVETRMAFPEQMKRFQKRKKMVKFLRF